MRVSQCDTLTNQHTHTQRVHAPSHSSCDAGGRETHSCHTLQTQGRMDAWPSAVTASVHKLSRHWTVRWNKVNHVRHTTQLQLLRFVAFTVNRYAGPTTGLDQAQPLQPYSRDKDTCGVLHPNTRGEVHAIKGHSHNCALSTMQAEQQAKQHVKAERAMPVSQGKYGTNLLAGRVPVVWAPRGRMQDIVSLAGVCPMQDRSQRQHSTVHAPNPSQQPNPSKQRQDTATQLWLHKTPAVNTAKARWEVHLATAVPPCSTCQGMLVHAYSTTACATAAAGAAQKGRTSKQQGCWQLSRPTHV